MQAVNRAARVFKTAWFARAAEKADIDDESLCEAIQDVMKGQADDLGGGVFKKRLNRNRHRSIVLAKGGRYWVYEYLFAKNNRANIKPDELMNFRSLARGYESLSDVQIIQLLVEEDLVEIFYGIEN